MKKVYDKSIKFDSNLAKGKVISEEDKSVGSIGWMMYVKYLSSGGWLNGVYILLVILFSQGEAWDALH